MVRWLTSENATLLSLKDLARAAMESFIPGNFQRGQPPNCRINSLILRYAKQGRRAELWFHQKDDKTVRTALEGQLIQSERPSWNIQRGFSAISVASGTLAMLGILQGISELFSISSLGHSILLPYEDCCPELTEEKLTVLDRIR